MLLFFLLFCFASVFIYRHFLRKPTSWDQFRGQWAIITGASEGIGREYAVQLAKKGMNVILMARTKSKLDALVQHIESSYGVQAKGIQFDFLKSSLRDYDRIAEEIKPLCVSVLVNNVGGGALPPEQYTQESLKLNIDRSLEEHDSVLSINTRPAVIMTWLVARQMREQKVEGRIINTSSLTGSIAMPMSAVYSGSKAFVDAYSRSMTQELKQFNIKVESHVPGNVHTSMNPTSGLDTCTADVYVRRSLDMFGTGNIVVPVPFHAIQYLLLKTLPEFFSLPVLMKKRLSDKQKALYHIQKQQ